MWILNAYGETMRKKITNIILSCAITLFGGMFIVYGQEKSPELKVNKRITIKKENKPLDEILYYLIVKYDIAIGFEESTLDRDHDDYEFTTNLPFVNASGIRIAGGVTPIERHWLTVNVEDGTLTEVLNIIVGQMRNYKWEINDDVINIFPISGRDERYEKLLALNIGNFKIESRKPIFLIRDNLFALPEVVKFLNENKIYSTTNRENFDFVDRKLPTELNFSNVTFRDLLNKITKVKRGGWILKQSDISNSKEKEYIDIEI